MLKKTAIKKVFKRIEKDYPLLRKPLRAYFVEIILLTYDDMKWDPGYDFMSDSEKLDYSYEINTCDEYHSIINDFNKNFTSQINDYLSLWDSYFLISCSH